MRAEILQRETRIRMTDEQIPAGSATPLGEETVARGEGTRLAATDSGRDIVPAWRLGLRASLETDGGA